MTTKHPPACCAMAEAASCRIPPPHSSPSVMSLMPKFAQMYCPVALSITIAPSPAAPGRNSATTSFVTETCGLARMLEI